MQYALLKYLYLPGILVKLSILTSYNPAHIGHTTAATYTSREVNEL
jgi:hypothetical protein